MKKRKKWELVAKGLTLREARKCIAIHKNIDRKRVREIHD